MVIKAHPRRRRVATVFIGRIVHSRSPTHLEILPRAALGVNNDGSIAFVLSHISNLDSIDGVQNAEKTYLSPSQFLFPGMVDTHLHAPQWPNLALGMDGTLREWIEDWTDPVEASYENNDKARQVYADVVKTTLGLGSTTVAYNSSFHTDATKILAEAAFEAGQRAIVGKMNVTQGSTKGNWEDSIETSLAETEKVIKFVRELDPKGRLVHPCVQPRGGPYCPPELMKGLGRLREKYGAYVQGHMCETLDDIDRTLQAHPNATSYSHMYLQNGLLNSKSVQAHCIHLQPSDVENLKSTGAGVAHNPNSNTCLRDGECWVRDLLDHGIKVGLGTDCSAGYMPSIHSAMRSASNVSRHLALKVNDARYVLSFSEMVWLATMGGAQVVNMEDNIGNFELGKDFVALLVDVKDVISVHTGLCQNEVGQDEALVKKWLFLGDDRTIRKVYVDGRLVAGHDRDQPPR